MLFQVLVSVAVCICLPLTSAAGQTAKVLLEDMSGTWNVEQRMWIGPGAAAVKLPLGIAERRLIEGKYLEESMQPTELAPGQPGFFVRSAVFNYNAVNKQYEYFSIDSRAPQAMSEKSAPTGMSGVPEVLDLDGGTFVAPEWGTLKNVRFKYRLTVSAVQDGRQTIELYLTPQSVLPKKEFLAFEYKYVRNEPPRILERLNSNRYEP